MTEALKKILRMVLVGPSRFFRTKHRDFVFWRAMNRFLRDPEGSLSSGNPVLTDLIYGWGSDWSALEEYLTDCVRHALVCNGPILECGSGLTTILVGAIAGRRKTTMWSLEHLPEWGERVNRYARKYRIASVNVSVRPLKDYSEFTWYDAPLESMPDTFALVICDGPPGGTRGARYGLAPIMSKRLIPGCVILLDDGAWDAQQTTAARWSAELGGSFTKLGSKKPYIRITLDDARGENLHGT